MRVDADYTRDATFCADFGGVDEMRRLIAFADDLTAVENREQRFEYQPECPVHDHILSFHCNRPFTEPYYTTSAPQFQVADVAF